MTAGDQPSRGSEQLEVLCYASGPTPTRPGQTAGRVSNWLTLLIFLSVCLPFVALVFAVGAAVTGSISLVQSRGRERAAWLSVGISGPILIAYAAAVIWASWSG